MDLTLPFHPRTGLQAVGIVGDRPVWPILGAEDDPANPVQPIDDPTPTGDPVDPADPVDPPATDPVEPAKPAGKTYGEKYVGQLRKEAADRRAAATAEREAREAAEAAATAATERSTQLESILSGLNAVLNPQAPKDEPADPEKLVAQLAEQESTAAAALAERDATIRGLQVANALPAVCAALKADPTLTAKVLKADGLLAELDPSAKSFTADLTSAVEKAIADNPALRAAPVVVKTGTEPTGRSGAPDQITREQLASMTPEQIAQAQKEGRLRAVLGGV